MGVVMRYPLRHVVQHVPHVMTENSLGDPIPGYGDPVDVKVIGWYLTGGQERGPNGHIFQVEYDAVVLTPDTLSVSPHDRFNLPGHDTPFEVMGPPGDWTNGPWWNPEALQVNLKRVV